MTNKVFDDDYFEWKKAYEENRIEEWREKTLKKFMEPEQEIAARLPSRQDILKSIEDEFNIQDENEDCLREFEELCIEKKTTEKLEADLKELKAFDWGDKPEGVGNLTRFEWKQQIESLEHQLREARKESPTRYKNPPEEPEMMDTCESYEQYYEDATSVHQLDNLIKLMQKDSETDILQETENYPSTSSYRRDDEHFN